MSIGIYSNDSSVSAQSRSESDLPEFPTWDEAHQAGYFTKSQFRRGVDGTKKRPRAEPPTATILHKDRLCDLYHRDQCAKPRRQTTALWNYLDRFVTRTDPFLICKPDGEYLEISDSRYDLEDLVKQAHSPKKCFGGFQVDYTVFGDEPYQYQNRRTWVQSIHVRGSEMTTVFAFDLDMHDSTPAAKKTAPLRLLATLERHLPSLLDQLWWGTWFYQYKQPEVSGIHVIVCLRCHWHVDDVHAAARQFLRRLEVLDPGLDAELDRSGLPTLDRIEIKPKEQAIALPGSYGRSVWTTHELKLVKGRFDVVGLMDFVGGYHQPNSVLPRYSALVNALPDEESAVKEPSSERMPRTEGSGQATVDDGSQSTSYILEISSDPKAGYWTEQKKLGRHGLPEPDNLYVYIMRLGQCLWFRDYFGLPDASTLVYEDLVYWCEHKDNGLISRPISKVKDQIRRIVGRIPKTTCEQVRRYYATMRLNDLRFPHRSEYLSDIIRGTKSLSTSFYCKVTLKEPNDSPLPSTVTNLLLAYCRDQKHRKKDGDYPFVRFTRRLLNELAQAGGSAHLNKDQMEAFLASRSRRQLQDYKHALVRLGYLTPGWEKYAKRGQRSCKYKMTAKAKQAMGIRNAAVAC